MSKRGDIARPSVEPMTLTSSWLVSRGLLADTAKRHEDVVKQRVQPVACDIASHRPLYDLDAALDTLGALPKPDQTWRQARRERLVLAS